MNKFDDRGIPIKTFAQAIYKYILSGLPKVTDEQYAARLAICDTCEQCDKTDTETWKCQACGCNLQEGTILPGKARWATQDCPLSKWPKLPLPNSASSPCCGDKAKGA
jgi:hypothetical protein